MNNNRFATSLALFCWILTLLLLVLALMFAAFNTQSQHIGGQLDAFTTPLALFAFATVGALVAARRPENAIGWIFCTVALLSIFGQLCGAYAVFDLVSHQAKLPWGTVAAWLGYWLNNLGFGLLVSFTLLLFPNGAPPSRRWRPVVWMFAALIALTVGGLMFEPGQMSDLYPSISNPFGAEPAGGILAWLASQANLVFGGLVVVSVASVIVRFRRAAGVERQQLKWFTFAGVLLLAALVLDSLAPLSDLMAGVTADLAFAFVPLAVGISILRYRLYDIDVIINRTLVYGVLTASLGAVYFGSVVLLESVMQPVTGQQHNDFVIVVSTLLIAILFLPLRRAIQRLIDRRFYRRRYDAARILTSFSGTLRDEVDLQRLKDELLTLVEETMQPVSISFSFMKPESTRKP